ncbi:AQJ64_40280 family protein [Streptomyces sp. M10(2022)]
MRKGDDEASWCSRYRQPHLAGCGKTVCAGRLPPSSDRGGSSRRAGCRCATGVVTGGWPGHAIGRAAGGSPPSSPPSSPAGNRRCAEASPGLSTFASAGPSCRMEFDAKFPADVTAVGKRPSEGGNGRSEEHGDLGRRTREDAADRLPGRSGDHGRYPVQSGESDTALGEEFWLVKTMYFTDRHQAEDGVMHYDCFVDSDDVVRFSYDPSSRDSVTHWTELPTLPGGTAHFLAGEDVRPALRNAWNARPGT